MPEYPMLSLTDLFKRLYGSKYVNGILVYNDYTKAYSLSNLWKAI